MSGSRMNEGKVGIVTGGGGAIGRAIALGLAESGARVVVVDIGASVEGAGVDDGPAYQVANEIKAKGGEAIVSTLSITEPGNADAIVAQAIEAFGRVDILVNNAGIIRDTMFHKMSWVDWHDVLNVHLNGSFAMSKAVAPHFREQGSGSFIHMTSTSALIGQLGQANYMAAKMGIVGMSRAIAIDMQRFGVRSNCISPFAWSRMIDTLPSNTPAEIARREKLMKMTPDKIAPMVVFLGSDRAEGVSGQIFAVRNNEVILMSQPRPLRSVHRSEGWTPETLEETLKPAMAASLVPLEVSADVFTWDPI